MRSASRTVLSRWAMTNDVRPSSNRSMFSFTARSDSVSRDRKSTRLNSSHTEIYTLSLHDALPIFGVAHRAQPVGDDERRASLQQPVDVLLHGPLGLGVERSEEHTSELQSHRDLHSFSTRRSSDLRRRAPCSAGGR